MTIRPWIVILGIVRQAFESFGRLFDGLLDRQTLHRARPQKALNAFRSLEDILSVFWASDWSTMTKHYDILVDSTGCISNILDGFYAILQGGRGGCTNGT